MINVKRDNPQEAADIANEIAQVYRDSRLDIASKNAQLAIDKIEESLADQRQRVALAEERIQNIREELNIAVVGGEGQFDVGEVRMQQLEGDRLFAQRAMLEKEGLITILNDLDDKDLLERASYITFDQFVMNTIQQIQDIEVQLSSLSANYGINHPEVKRLQLQVDTLEDKLDKRLRALRNGLETEYIIAKNNFESLDSVLTSVRSDTIASQGSKFRPYRNALADLETERFIYNQLKSRHRQEIITLKVPKNPVELIDVAEPELRPVSPNLFLNVLLSIFIGLGAGVGLAYFIEYLDTSVKNSDDLERVLAIPVVGQVPQKVRPLIEEGPDSDNAEPYRVLKTNLSSQTSKKVAWRIAYYQVEREKVNQQPYSI